MKDYFMGSRLLQYFPTSAVYCSEKIGGMVDSNNHRRLQYYVWPQISGQVLGNIFIDLSRCYSSIKNGPVFGKKVEMETVLTAKFTRIK